MTKTKGLGQRMRLARIAAGLKQEDVARELGIGKSSISEYEGDKRSPSIDQIEQIAEVLNTTYMYLLGWDKPDLSEAALTVAARYDRLTPSGQRFIESALTIEEERESE